MKRLLFILMLIPTLVFSQAWDSTKTTDTPRGGMYKFNAGIKSYILGKKADTTGWSSFTNPIMVLQGDTLWVAREGTLDSTTAGRTPYKSSSSTLSNISGVFIPIGLVSGGVTDNRSAIQTALTAANTAGGGRVYLPLGTFSVSDTLNLYNNVSLEGEGTLKATATFTGSGVVVSRNDTSASVKGISIDLSAITALTTSTTSDSLTNVSGIFVYGGSKVTIDGVKITGQSPSRDTVAAGPDWGTGCGVEVQYSSDVKVMNSTIDGSPMHGVGFGPKVTNSSILNNIILNTARNNGIEIIGDVDAPTDTTLYSTGNVVSGNHCVGNGDAGIEIYLSPRTTVIGNSFIDNNLHIVTQTSPTITIERGSNNSTITGNVCVNGYRGIVALGTSFVTITANTVKSHTSIGIDIEYGYSVPSDNCVISSNILRNLSAQGIYVFRSGHAQIIGNVIDSSGTNGLELSDTSHYCTINANKIYNSHLVGIYLNNANKNVVNGNMLVNNSAAGYDSASGITVGGTSEYNNISGNVVADTRDSAQQAYGISVAPTTRYNIVSGNTLAGQHNQGLEPSGDTLTVYYGNLDNDSFQGQFVVERATDQILYTDASDGVNVVNALNVFGQASFLASSVIRDSVNHISLITNKMGQSINILFKDSLTLRWSISKNPTNDLLITDDTGATVVSFDNSTNIATFAEIVKQDNDTLATQAYARSAAAGVADSSTWLATDYQVSLKAPLASPTFTGTVTVPSPFTLGATSVTSTGVQFNYLNGATGTTGTTTTNLVFSTSPVLVTPTLGAATATSLAVGGASLDSSVSALGIKGRGLVLSGSGTIPTVNHSGNIQTLGKDGTYKAWATPSLAGSAFRVNLDSLGDSKHFGAASFEAGGSAAFWGTIYYGAATWNLFGKAPTYNWLPMITRNTAGAEAVADLGYIGKVGLTLHTIVAGDSVFGTTFVDAADSTMKTWNGTAWITIKDLTP